MIKYFKATKDILINYKLSFISVMFFELIFYLFFKKEFNRFDYLKSNIYSHSIPCPFFFLIKIRKFLIQQKIDNICDLGSGYGKILYYLGNLQKFIIDGVELNKKIYYSSLILSSKKIQIYNEDILTFNLKKKNYEAFILNDPLKNPKDLEQLIIRIKNNYKKIFLIFINLDLKKQKLIKKNFKIIEKFKASKNKNIFYCKSH